MGNLRPTLFHYAYQADARMAKLRRRALQRLGLARPFCILPYRGFGTTRSACVKARVLEHRDIPPIVGKQTVLGSALASYRRYATVEIPDVHVRVRWGGQEWEGVTDDEGFLDLWINPPEGISGGWHTVELEVMDPDVGTAPARAEASVFIAGNRAEYGVISDVDDTVIVTGVTNLLKRARSLFLTEVRTRLPFEGVSAFYSALHRGVSGDAHNPIFYVSSSPWNLYEFLDEFLEAHDIPMGPMLLRDWGLSRHGFAPGGGHGHKLEKIRTVLEAVRDLPFILIGDSGQEDPEHYRTIVKEYPGRIAAVYIRTVHPRLERASEVEQIGGDVTEAGSMLVAVKDTVAAARHAAQHGWIQWEGIEQVREKKKADQNL